MAKKRRKSYPNDNVGPHAAGKGSHRRDQEVSDAEMTVRWCLAFGCTDRGDGFCRCCGEPIEK